MTHIYSIQNRPPDLDWVKESMGKDEAILFQVHKDFQQILEGCCLIRIFLFGQKVPRHTFHYKMPVTFQNLFAFYMLQKTQTEKISFFSLSDIKLLTSISQKFVSQAVPKSQNNLFTLDYNSGCKNLVILAQNYTGWLYKYTPLWNPRYKQKQYGVSCINNLVSYKLIPNIVFLIFRPSHVIQENCI